MKVKAFCLCCGFQNEFDSSRPFFICLNCERKSNDPHVKLIKAFNENAHQFSKLNDVTISTWQAKRTPMYDNVRMKEVEDIDIGIQLKTENPLALKRIMAAISEGDLRIGDDILKWVPAAKLPYDSSKVYEEHERRKDLKKIAELYNNEL